MKCYRPLSIRPFIAASLGLALSACSSVSTIKAPELPALTTHDPVGPAEAVETLAVTPQMHDFLDRYVLPYENDQLRVTLLLMAVTDKGVLGYHYNERQTLAAPEAFQRRSGNCVSFANLFISLAREAGLRARFQEVELDPVWNSRKETLLVTKHINVVVESGPHSYTVDVSGEQISPKAPRRVLTDEEAQALYYNNLGADALVDEDYGTAYAWFLRAIETYPQLEDSWSNLGVLYARNGQGDAAEKAYLHALALNRREMSAMNNLHGIYADQGRIEEASALQRKVERYRQENPYYLLYLGEEALALGDLGGAERLLRRGIRLRDDIHQLHYALAQVRYLEGDHSGAEASLQRARDLAPRDVLAQYQHDIDKLPFHDRLTEERLLPD